MGVDSMNRKKRFPDDMRVTVIRADLTTYKQWESVNLLMVHKFNGPEIRVLQANRKKL